MATPTLINLPPPPSDPVTPSELGPGTPNSGTTSLSALSTTAIKDGHQGTVHSSHHHGSSGRHLHARDASSSSLASNTSTTTLDAERADRISRLAGLERVSTVRQSAPHGHGGAAPPVAGEDASGFSGLPPHPGFPTAGGPTAPFAVAQAGGAGNSTTTMGYFDASGSPVLGKERSTVGSASATGSAGVASGTTPAWASTATNTSGGGVAGVGGAMSGVGGGDRMSVSETNSHDGDPDVAGEGMISDDDGDAGSASHSLVGFGEGASSTLSGPTSSLPPHLALGRRQQQQQQQTGPGAGAAVAPPKMLDGMTYDRDVLDTTARAPPPVGTNTALSSSTARHAGLSGAETAERIVNERLGRAELDDVTMDGADDGGKPLGKFAFEER